MIQFHTTRMLASSIVLKFHLSLYLFLVYTSEVTCSKFCDICKRSMSKKRAKESLRQGGHVGYMEALDHFWEKKKEADVEKELKKDERYQ
uniref:Uncharacterized protein n=1 Tax=Arundo donax TaxID=35708 RepID=A0A0A9DIK8_ARUDO